MWGVGCGVEGGGWRVYRVGFILVPAHEYCHAARGSAWGWVFGLRFYVKRESFQAMNELQESFNGASKQHAV